jgi:hypothetical protein
VSHLSEAKANAKPSSSSHVYMFTGLLGITSGLDGVVEKIKQRGFATTMVGPAGWASSAETAIQSYKSGQLRSIVIIGYSTGGKSALEMAAELNNAKVPVQLVVLFDAMSGPAVTPNVRRLVNFHVPGGYGATVSRPKNFAGVLQDVPAKDPSVGHFTIIDAYERQVLGLVASAAGRSGGAPAPTPAAPSSTDGSDSSPAR